jgi:LuxR family maltose regulon positive regulatory protein
VATATIISAPAGSGKTSLIGAWADRLGGPHWLALVPVQRDQHDAQQFWLALLDAVYRATGAAGDAEPAAATPEFNAPAMADRVLSELGDARGNLTLVIEDLHELASPAALAQLTRLLTNLPPNVHAIVSTCRDLQLRLHRLRLAGELAEIRAADLRFPSAKPASFSTPWVSRCQRPGRRCCTSGRKGGPRACGSR